MPGISKSYLNNKAFLSLKNETVFQQGLFLCFLLSVSLLISFPSLNFIIKYGILPLILLFLYRYPLFDYLVFPLSFLDNTIGTMVFGKFTLLVFYLLLLLFKYFSKKKLLISVRETCVLLMSTVYFLLAYSSYEMVSIKLLFVVIATIFISRNHINDEKKLQLLLFVIFSSSMLEAITLSFGLTGTIELSERATGIGFSDPNYASSICVYGFCALVNFKPSKKWLRLFQIICSLLLIVGVFRSGSRSGFIVLMMIIIIKIFLLKGVTNKAKYILFVGLAVTITIYLIGSGIIRIPNFNNIINRWVNMLMALNAGDYGAATVQRSTIMGYYWNYFVRQDLFHLLLGGNIIGSDKMLAVGHGHVTHNVYLDYLLAFGLVFSAFFFYDFLRRTKHYYDAYRKTGSSVYLSLVELKLSMLLIGMSLAMLKVYQWWFLALI